MTQIAPGAQRYTNTIHTDPCCPVTRIQIAKANPAIGAMVCISGMQTRAKCGIRVVDHTGQACDQFGCTNNLSHGVRAGVVISQTGDSGAPIYTQAGTTAATINGMHVAKPAGVTRGEILFS